MRRSKIDHAAPLQCYPLIPKMSVPLIFYTTAEQEATFEATYQERLAAKEAELALASKSMNKPNKYTAKAYVEKPYRVFTVTTDGAIYFGTGNIPQPTAPAGGKSYIIDPRYASAATAFMKANYPCAVVFMPSGRYGPTIHWCGTFGSTPAYLEGPAGDRFDTGAEDDYDIGCL